MEPPFLLDTNICLYICQSKPEQVLHRFHNLRPGEAALSVITYGELPYGAANSAPTERWLCSDCGTLSNSFLRWPDRKKRPTTMERFAPNWSRKAR
jgi:tRNA(fMet)-specific endonuclease VapC